jgi:hypothetical protein
MWFRTQAYLGDAYDHGASRSEPALTAWTDEELAATAGANELAVAPLRNDGTDRARGSSGWSVGGTTSTSDP